MHASASMPAVLPARARGPPPSSFLPHIGAGDPGASGGAWAAAAPPRRPPS